MDITQIIITTAVTALVSGVVGAIVATMVSAVKDKARDHSETDEAIKEGMRALLWRELKNFHDQAMTDGGLNTEDRHHLDSVYSAYHGMGGNGTGTRIYEDAMRQPIID